jgi:hypothetical protein
MKYLKYLLLASLAAFMFVSCSDDDDDNPINNNNNTDLYFDAQNGDWWIYYNAGLDQNEDEVDTYHDTTKAVETKDFTDANGITKNTTVYETKTTESSETETSYFSETKSGIWTTTDFILPEDLGEIDLPIDVIAGIWIKIIDRENNNWTVFEEITIEDVPIPGLGNQDVSYEVLGEFAGTESRQVMGSNMNVDHYEITTKISVTLLGSPISIDILSNLYFANGIGLVEIYIPPVSIDLVIRKLEFDGSKRVLMDTSKK